jgi:uncharacterized protein YndB with AHSA1/START domain
MGAMRAFAYETHISRSPDDVFAFMMDFDRASRWRNRVRKMELVTPPPVGVGSQLRITMDVKGTQKEAISEVWAYDPPRRFGQRNTASNVTGTFEYLLEPERGGTHVRFTCDVRPHGIMWLLLLPMIRSSRYRYRDQLSILKREIERTDVGSAEL